MQKRIRSVLPSWTLSCPLFCPPLCGSSSSIWNGPFCPCRVHSSCLSSLWKKQSVCVCVGGGWHPRQMLQTSFGGWVYLFGEGDLTFFRGLLDRSLLLLLQPLIDDHISDYIVASYFSVCSSLFSLTHLVRLRLRLLSLEWERLLWPCRELWESGPNLHGIYERMNFW